jgi:KaiC/GvpD/RAD55 family RecA-like ATPase
MAMEFTPEFQLRILVWLCYDPEEGKYWAKYLESYLFEFESLKWLSEIIKSSYEEYKKPPTRMQIESDFALTAPDFEDQDTILYSSFLEMMDEGFEEIEYVRSVFPRFIRARKLVQTLYADDLEKARDEGDWAAVRDALKTHEPQLERPEIDMDRVFSVSIFSELFEDNTVMPTGFPLIDTRMDGLRKKEMMFILADTGVGKSLLMTYIGARVVEAGFRVLHVSLEVSTPRNMVRYVATFEPERQISIHDIQQMRKPEELVYAMDRIKEQYYGRFYLCDLPTSKGTVEDVERLVDQTGPDLVVLDYLDLMKPIFRRDRRFEIAELAQAMRGMAVEKDFHILSASQTNRSGHDTRVVDINMTAEDYDKIRTADDVIGLGQTRIDLERNQLVAYVGKARNSQKGVAHRYQIDIPHIRFDYMRPELLYSRETADGAAQPRRRRQQQTGEDY